MSYYQESFQVSSSGSGAAQDLNLLNASRANLGGFSYSVSANNAALSNSGAAAVSGVAAGNSSVDRIAADLLALNRTATVRQSAAGFQSSGAGFQSSGAGFQSSGAAAFQASGAGFQSGAAAFQSGAAFQSSGAASASFNASSNVVLSEIEQAILRSNIPIEINESEEITVNGQRGTWLNKAEIVNWRGIIPITEYLINEDANPEIITKRSQQQIEYIQELAIRYLRPPTPPAPGEIIITQELNSLTPPAPPLIIRQQPPRPDTPEPLVIREAPPQPPAQVGRKVITISGKRIPPPPRKVIIERLAPLPSKPQSVLIERWLPYAQVKRRVIFQKSNERDAVVVKPRNVIVQWEAPQVNIRKEVKFLGVIRANPVEYVQRYGASLKVSRELPQFVLDIQAQEGHVFAADYQYNSVYELEGAVQALKLVDLEREGLSEYRAYLEKLGISYVGASNVLSAAAQLSSLATSSFAASGAAAGGASAGGSYGASFNGASQGGFSASFGGASLGGASSSFGGASAIAEIFASIDGDGNGKLSVSEAERVLLRLNSRLGRQYGEDEVRAFFARLDSNGDGQIDINEFRAAFERL